MRRVAPLTLLLLQLLPQLLKLPPPQLEFLVGVVVSPPPTILLTAYGNERKERKNEKYTLDDIYQVVTHFPGQLGIVGSYPSNVQGYCLCQQGSSVGQFPKSRFIGIKFKLDAYLIAKMMT